MELRCKLAGKVLTVVGKEVVAVSLPTFFLHQSSYKECDIFWLQVGNTEEESVVEDVPDVWVAPRSRGAERQFCFVDLGCKNTHIKLAQELKVRKCKVVSESVIGLLDMQDHVETARMTHANGKNMIVCQGAEMAV